MIISAIGSGGNRSSGYHDDADRWDVHRKNAQGYIPYAVTGIILSAFVPTMQTILALVAWELGTSIDGIENIPANMVEYLNTLVGVELQELKEAAKVAADQITDTEV